jgi:hypothetical protein
MPDRMTDNKFKMLARYYAKIYVLTYMLRMLGLLFLHLFIQPGVHLVRLLPSPWHI